MTTSYLDFQQVKDQHPIEQVAERLGLELKKAGHQLRGPCFSGAEGDRKFVITPSKNAWYSFALNEGGDAIRLVQLVNNVSAKEAAAWIAGTEPEKGRSERSSSPDRPERGLRPIDYLEPDHPAVDALGIDPEDAARIGLGWAPRGILKNTVAVPIRTADGTLIGYVGIMDPIKLPPQWKW